VSRVEPPEPTRLGEVPWLEPYPDALLEAGGLAGLAGLAGLTGPEARYEERDRICALTRFENSVLPWFGLPRSLPGR
jgi:hypothetical protein